MFDSSELSLGTLALEGSTSSVSCNDQDDLESQSQEVIRTIDGGGDVTLRLEVAEIAAVWRALVRHQSATAAAADKVVARDDAAAELLRDASLASGGSDDAATDALARTINKTDFETMEVVGQFNLGFIVARRRVAAAAEDGARAMDDLFIVDQHAADEKYNFETLQQTTQIQSQKLFRPQPLELTASDELLALENIDVLRRNGFEVVAGTETETAPRLALTAQPVSKDTVFDMKDLEELIHRMRDAPAGTTPRCAKARAMFAMRACRKSVMVGMPLTQGQMTAVVRHMGTMDQPWNCPHGRPTMRHLADIMGGPQRERRKVEVDWAAFG
ncbi:MutL C terminal dimerization domain-containing protein [Mycena pura]|uniref:MutL C terminal dimerization domain-containing protein n=1 Tax=Mycena pura TaxID=153505 RepID=A0AAD6Y6N5_9AGAR|nr:MutL C terminal dimerization domain-containing protein [Mycena pura]